jgi:TonB family protein
MFGPMAPVTAAVKATEPAFELPIHARLPRLDLAVDWGSPWDEFRSSVRDFYRGPRAPKYEDLPKDSDLQVDWVRDRFSVRSFLAACLWHVAAITLLILPIWGFLPKPDQNLAPVRIELTYVPNSDDLPTITLPLPGKKAKAGPKIPDAPATRGADSFHPRQTILSEPLRITHPRQTLIQPDAPAAPPKIDTPLPNIVQWSQPAEIAKPKMHYTPSTAAPKIRQRAVRDIDAPEIPEQVQNPGELNIAPSPALNSVPKMPVMPMSAAAAKARQVDRRESAPAAPEIAEGPAGNSNLPSVVALSATPAPPAPEVNVPQGNLAARISMSPEGGHGGAPGAPPSPAPSKSNAGAGGTGGNSSISGGGGSTANLPAAVSVSGGSGHGGGGITPSGTHSGGLILHPMTTVPERPTAMMSSRRGPVDVAHLDPSLPPETLLSGKQIYTLHVNLPNLTSVSGSWVLHFAQLDESYPPYRAQGPLSAPDPLLKVDPEYPPDAVKQHIDGEVVLYAVIRKDGSVDSIQLVKGIDPRLDSNAMKAFAKWKFKPGMRDGAPVDIEAVVHIPFSFRKPED